MQKLKSMHIMSQLHSNPGGEEMNHAIRTTASFEGMNNERHDYDACYNYHEEWGLYGLHCHDFYELYIHYGGAKLYCVDNNVYPLEPDQLVVVPPFCMHGLLGDSAPRNYERAFLYITPATLKLCGAGTIDLERFLGKYIQSGQCHFQMSHEDAQQCKILLQQMAQDLHSTSSMTRFTNHVRMVNFLSIACQNMKNAKTTTEPIVVNEVMHEILSYINENYTQQMKLETLARQFGVSVSFLSHEFVRYTGRSVYDYVLHRRVQMAKAMITEAIPLNEVAYRCGFNDYSNFLRVFSKMAGMSPSAFRKRSKEAQKDPKRED